MDVVEPHDEQVNVLVQYIMDKFESAKISKNAITERMIRNLYALKCEYPPDKLVKIRELGGSEIYLPLVNIKCRALKAWLTDIFFSGGDPPFDIAPTPVPSLTDESSDVVSSNLSDMISDILKKAALVSQLSNGAIDMQEVIGSLKKSIGKLRDSVDSVVYEYALRIAERQKRRINDQFVEGGFYDALNECLYDLAIFPCAIMKSCVPRRTKVFDRNRVVVEKVIPTYNRVSPFDLFPSPFVSDFSDYVIEILHLAPHELKSMKGIEGYDDDIIDIVVGLYGETGYQISYTGRSERVTIEGKTLTNYDLIDVIEFWGPVKGSIIKEADVSLPAEVDIEDDEFYEVCVWICDGYILRFVFNPDPLGAKPYHKTSFIEIPDSFWGLSLVDVLYDLQEGVNAIARATINNSALSSGPMIERNIDRIPPNEEKVIIPWKIFDSVGFGVGNEPAYRFYQPSLTANALIQVIAYYMKLADELSGVPAYAHGDVTVGGAGRTASGLNLLVANASRGIKEVVMNIDSGIIEPAVKRTYYFNVIDFYGLKEEIPDLNIRAKGSLILMEKMAQTQRMLELLQLTNNPIDLNLLGLEGRKYLLEHIFKNFGIQVPFKSELEEMVNSLQAQLQQQMVANNNQSMRKPRDIKSPVVEEAQAMRQNMLGEGEPAYAPALGQAEE